MFVNHRTYQHFSWISSKYEKKKMFALYHNTFIIIMFLIYVQYTEDGILDKGAFPMILSSIYRLYINV